jgi:CheY-like chemotaxis protein
MKILYVEDDADDRSSVTGHLEDLGHEVMTASSIAEAVSVLSRNSFDRIICDGTLRPGKVDNGVEFATRLVDEGKKAVVYSSDTRRVPRHVPSVSKHDSGSLRSRIERLLAS